MRGRCAPAPLEGPPAQLGAGAGGGKEPGGLCSWTGSFLLQHMGKEEVRSRGVWSWENKQPWARWAQSLAGHLIQGFVRKEPVAVCLGKAGLPAEVPGSQWPFPQMRFKRFFRNQALLSLSAFN